MVCVVWRYASNPAPSDPDHRKGHCNRDHNVLCCIPTGTGTLCQLQLVVVWHQLRRPFASLRARCGPRRGTRSFAAVIVSAARCTALHRTERAFTCSASPTPRLLSQSGNGAIVYIISHISYPLLYDIRVYVARIRTRSRPGSKWHRINAQMEQRDRSRDLVSTWSLPFLDRVLST